MNILIVSQYFWPENFKINDLALGLIEKGHDVTVLTGKPNYPTGILDHDYRNNPKKFDSYYGCKILRVPILYRGQNRFQLALNYISFLISALTIGFQKIKNNIFDVVITYQPSPITVAIPSVFFSKYFKLPHIIWVQDSWPETLFALDVIKSKIANNFLNYFVGIIYKNCDLILTQSNGIKEIVNQKVGKEVWVEYFPVWPEKEFETLIHDEKYTLPRNPNGINIIFAGNIGEAQDFYSILNAFELLNNKFNIRLYIIGNGRLASWVKNQILIRNLHNVVMLGFFPLIAMPSFFKSADALLVTLRNESIFNITIPSKIQSYLKSGVPIIGMLSGEGASIIKESGGIVADAGNSSLLAKNLIIFSKISKDKRNEIGIKGKLYCNDKFNRDILLEQFNFFLNKLRQSNHE